MNDFFSRLINQASDYLTPRKALLPLIGIGLVLLNFLLVIAAPGLLSSSDFFLHVGIILAVLGLMIAKVL